MMRIGKHKIGLGRPVFVVAELSANHRKSYHEATHLVRAAARSGADAIKVQTFTPDTITIDSQQPWFRINDGPWAGRTLWELYDEASMPWEWQPDLKKLVNDLGMEFFSSPFDETAVDFLDDMGVAAFKIASFEIVDLPLIRYAASKGKPLIISTGMATFMEVAKAVDAARQGECESICLLKCTSAYPSPLEDLNLRMIRRMRFGHVRSVGLSDHTLSDIVPALAVAMGAMVIEKHFTMSRSAGGPDAAFSLEPAEFGRMVANVRIAEKALGHEWYGTTGSEEVNTVYRPSLFAVEDIEAGELLATHNIKSIRPGNGLPPDAIKLVLGRTAKLRLTRGTPLTWEGID